MGQFPDDETGDALNQFQENGFDLSKPMEVDFFVAVPSKSSGEYVAVKAEEAGFSVSVEQDVETGEWTCYCTKKILPEYSEIVKLEKQLDKMAGLYGGYADGFGSFGNS
ncbi:hypothetical protein CK501_15670 [Halovibrio salipaludis]|uniref:Regulator of ribonuclease activity B domain-containing protein n=1 Tax=Halovibrio salipaludis TaxID=2032626 RepID=A0A2A2EXI4_9GAMM|nr:ribonuclease E inhibitor RraB [Halovibrio salipaludis]PAU77003.1 hypothetical protein CK501_15670 [Halovibrio salipaludis]